jgi:SAM-dependent methyltransferase
MATGERMVADSSATYPRDVGRRVVDTAFPSKSYSDKYQDWFFDTHATRITGRTLDVGAEADQRARYDRHGADVDEYVALDQQATDSLTVRGDAGRLPFKSGTFDTVICREVIEHIPVAQVHAVLSEIHRVLVDGGTLLLTSPFRFPIHGLSYSDTLRLTADGLQRALVDAGFDDVDVFKCGGFTETLLSPLQRAWTIGLEKFDADPLSPAFALVHYPVVVFGTLLSWVVVGLYGDNLFGKIFYLHNAALATKGAEG